MQTASALLAALEEERLHLEEVPATELGYRVFDMLKSVGRGVQTGVVRTNAVACQMPTMDPKDLLSKRRMLLDAARGDTDFGEFSWLTAFDGDDQSTFRLELLDALFLASDSLAPAERCITEWRTTARALSIEKSRRILIGAGAAFSEVERHE